MKIVKILTIEYVTTDEAPGSAEPYERYKDGTWFNHIEAPGVGKTEELEATHRAFRAKEEVDMLKSNEPKDKRERLQADIDKLRALSGQATLEMCAAADELAELNCPFTKGQILYSKQYDQYARFERIDVDREGEVSYRGFHIEQSGVVQPVGLRILSDWEWWQPAELPEQEGDDD